MHINILMKDIYPICMAIPENYCKFVDDIWQQQHFFIMQAIDNLNGPMESAIATLSGKDNLDGQLFVFSDIRDLALPGEPFKVMMPVFAVCTQGHASVKINLVDYEIDPEMMLSILPDHIIHGYSISPDFKGMFLSVSRQYIEKVSVDVHTLLPYVLDLKSSPMITLEKEEFEVLRTLYNELCKKIKNKTGYYDRNIIYHLLHAMLYEMLNVYLSRNRYSSTRRSRSEIIFHSFVHLVEQGFKVNRSVAYYANQLYITPKHLSVVVKSICGKTAGEWIDDYVMLSAKVLLSSSSKTVKEISAELNFANQSFFGKFFSQHAGMSPNKFRTLVNNNPNFIPE